MKERRETERNMMIKEEAAEDISGGGRGFTEKNRRGESTSDEEGRGVRASAAEIEGRGLTRREERGEMRRRRIEAGCCAVTVH